MTSAGFHVTPEQVSLASISCTRTAGEIQTQLQGLRNYVVNLEAVWKGIAQDTFQELMRDYDIYAQMMHDALVNIGSGLNGNYVNYREGEVANIAALSPVDGHLMPGQPGFHLPPSRF